mgnify:FL=1
MSQIHTYALPKLNINDQHFNVDLHGNNAHHTCRCQKLKHNVVKC